MGSAVTRWPILLPMRAPLRLGPSGSRAERHPGAPARGGSAVASLVTFGAATLDGRRNGLNLVRLMLALAVLVAHGWYLSGHGVGPHFAGQNIGTWAVYGFFIISGYLITGSRLTRSLGEYVLHRIARIFPAYLVCLVVVGFVFAPVGYYAGHHTIDGFLTTATTPLQYVIGNATLRISAYDVAGTPAGVPYPSAWDGSLWSLYYEFICYVVIAILASFGVFRRRPAALAAAFLASVALQIGVGTFSSYVQGNVDVVYLSNLLPFFLAGGLLYMLRDRITLTWPLAVLATAGALALAHARPAWGPHLAAPLMAYAVLWFGAVLPCPRLIRRNDVSYGIYIYAFPVQQLFAYAGAAHWNLAVYDLAAAAATVPLAVASWLLVERPAMRRARRSTAWLPGGRSAVPLRDDSTPVVVPTQHPFETRPTGAMPVG